MMILGLAMDGLLHWDALGLPHVCCNSFWLELLLWKNLWVGLTMRPRCFLEEGELPSKQMPLTSSDFIVFLVDRLFLKIPIIQSACELNQCMA